MVSDRKFNVGDKVAILSNGDPSVICSVERTTKTGMFYVDDPDYDFVRFRSNGDGPDDIRAVHATDKEISYCQQSEEIDRVSREIRGAANAMDRLYWRGIRYSSEDLVKIDRNIKRIRKIVDSYGESGL